MRGDGPADGDAGRAIGGRVIEEFASDSAPTGTGASGASGGFIKDVRDEAWAPGIAGRGAVGGGCGDGE